MSAQSKEEHVHHVFEKIYNKYDVMNSVISFQRHKAWRKDVMEHMYIKPGSTALDVCCGTGDWALSMAQAVGKSGSVTGLDFSQNMLFVGKEKRAAETGRPDVEMGDVSFIHGNAMDLPYPDCSFDYVTIGFGLRNVPDYDTVLKEMHRVLKPGGKAVCLETSQPNLIGFKQLYFAYFRFIMPVLGKLFAKSYQEYTWLQQSARAFPDKQTLKKMFVNAGFDRVVVKSYTGGVAAMHMAFKE